MTTITFDLAKMTKPQVTDCLMLAAQVHRADEFIDSEPSPSSSPLTAEAGAIAVAEEAVEKEKQGLDKAGVPWDERIHSSSKKLTTKGLWARRKGITNELYDEITTLLKTPGEQANLEIPTIGNVPPVAGSLPPASLPVDAPAPSQLPSDPQLPVESEEGITWIQIVQAIAASTTAGVFNSQRADQLVKHFGVDNIGQLCGADYAPHYEAIYNDEALGIKGF